MPVWFDDTGPDAAAGLTAWGETWEADVFAVPSVVDQDEVRAAALEAAAGQRQESLQVLVFGDQAPMAELAVGSGFAAREEL